MRHNVVRSFNHDLIFIVFTLNRALADVLRSTIVVYGGADFNNKTHITPKTQGRYFY